MFAPDTFKPICTSIVPSHNIEVFQARQSPLALYRGACASALSKLDPEVVQGLLAQYQPTSPHLNQSLYEAIASREYGVERQIGQDLNMEWMHGASVRGANDAGFLVEDDWAPGPQ
jgi:hypothetical protein